MITSPLNFRIHGYPDDYWRMTPSCLRGLLEPYGARLSGFQGYHAFPHTVMGVAIKAPIPFDATQGSRKSPRAISSGSKRRRRPCRSARKYLRAHPDLPFQRRAAPDRQLLHC